MAISAIGASTPSISPALVSALYGAQSQTTASSGTPAVATSQDSTLAATTVVTQTSSTSVSGQVTTVTTYADGSSKTTVSEGDSVVFSNKKAA